MLEVISKLQDYWSRFNILQKGIVLGGTTIISSLLTTFWLPFICYALCVPVASFGATKILRLKQHLDVTSGLSEIYGSFGKPAWVLAVDFYQRAVQHIRTSQHGPTQTQGPCPSPGAERETYGAPFNDSPFTYLTSEEGVDSTPEIEISQCLVYVKRDFLHSWYSFISEEEAFKDEAEELLDQLAMEAVDYVKRVNLLEIIPDFISIIREHVIDYQEAINKLKVQPNVRYKKDRTKEFKKIKSIEEAFGRLGKFHIAAKNDGELREVYLRSLMDTIMKVLIPEKAFSCYIAKELLLEIITSMVLVSLVDMFCDSDFLHKVMVLILSDDELIDLKQSVDTDHPSHNPATMSSKFSECPPDELCPDSSVPLVDVPRVDQPPTVLLPLGISHFFDDKSSDMITKAQALLSECSDLEDSTKSNQLDNGFSNDVEHKGDNETTIRDASKCASVKEENSSPVDIVKHNSSVDLENLAKHFKILGHSEQTIQRSLETSSCSGSPLSEINKASPPVSFDINPHGGDQFGRRASISPNNSLSDIEIPTNISFKRSFFIESDDEESKSVSDELDTLGDGSPSAGSVLGGVGFASHSDIVDGNILPPIMKIEAMAENSSTINLPNTQQPLRKAASCEVLSNNPPLPSLPISASTADLVAVGHPGGNEVKSQVEVNGKKASQRNMSIDKHVTLSPEPFGTGHVEATSREMPNYLYQDVQIPGTEQTRDPSRVIYTLYVIKYRAWHLEDDTWVLRKTIAKRRYREFVTLQERLEEHPIYKKKIKGIKGPHRWNVIGLGQFENHGIESRRKFLESYLQALIHREQVGNSLAMREFLAYEEDAHIAFVKKAHEVHVPRIDKLIAKTVSGVLNKITRTNSSSSFEPRNRSNPRLKGRTVSDEVDTADLSDVDAYILIYSYQHSDQDEIHTMENVLTQHIHTQEYLSSIDLTTVELQDEDVIGDKPGITDNMSDIEEFKDPLEESLEESCTQEKESHIIGSEAEASVFNQDNACQPPPLASAVLDIAMTLIQGRNSWFMRERTIHSFKMIAGMPFECFLEKEIQDLVTPERWCHYIRLLSATIWPHGELDATVTPPLTDQQRATRANQARSCLVNFFPGFLPHVIGHEDFDFAVDEVMSIIQHKALNRHLVFTLLDKAVETLFPEVKIAEIQEELRRLHIQPEEKMSGKGVF